MATKVVRDKVVAFRVTEEQHAALLKKLKTAGITGAPTVGLMARKLTFDWFDDAIAWKDKIRQKMSPEAFKAHQALNART